MSERISNIVQRGLDEADARRVAALLERTGQSALHSVLVGGGDADESEGPLPPERDPDVTIMARATFGKLQERLQAYRDQLATVLDDLEKARQFGDLSENSEYETAREQRAMLMASIEATTRDMERARFLEDLEHRDGVALPGCEVTLRDTLLDEERTIWLLGEGDSYLADHAVSYLAPLGQAILGAKQGDRVTFDLGETTSTLEILRVERRLP